MSATHSPKRTISIGGATFDLFISADHSIVEQEGGRSIFALPLGAKIRVNEVTGVCGGGANNTSVGLSRLGCDARFSGVLGNDQWGQALLKNLETEGVDTRFATIVENETSSFSVVLSASSGERVILYDSGVNTHLHDVTFAREATADADWVYLNHIQQETCQIEDDIITILRESPHAHLTWNPGGCQLERGMHAKDIAGLLAQTDFLVLNKEESLLFTGKTTAEDALKALSAAGVKAVCITDGGNGSMATDGKTLFQCPAPPCNVVDSTGAGDAFGVGATWALLNGQDLPTALRAGTINAMSVVETVGAQKGLLTETQMHSRFLSQTIPVSSQPL